MQTINAVLELGKDGYGVWFKELPNIFGFGKNVQEAKGDAALAIDGFLL
ncbi:hypothetical protein AwDysgo_17260 [Bacteroidales bacterium]|nr:hypothetical protein AwDysgo_17260 [Bacteroidales bacterium]